MQNKTKLTPIVILFLILIILLTTLASASFSIGNLSHSIDTAYSKNDFIRGWINISLQDESIESLFETNFGDSIKLIDLLKLNDNAKFSCAPTSCKTDYSSKNGETQKTFNLARGESKIFGLRFTGDIQLVESINFSVYSDAQSSCINQLKIDVLNDNLIDAGNDRVYDEPCHLSEKYGCFDESKTSKEYNIKSTPHCQKIKLSESPGFKIGAWIKEKSNGTKKINMALYDIYGGEVEGAKCELSNSAISSAGGEVSCSVEHLVTKSKYYYVCIFAGSGSGEYQIKGYSATGDGACGFYGDPVQNEAASYHVFAIGKKFNSVETVEIKNSLPNGEIFSELAGDYLNEIYGMDCSDECTIPIKLISETNQRITIDNLELKYEETSGSVSENKFYDLDENPAKIDMEFQKLQLDEANFSVSNEYGEKEFELKLDNKKIFSEKISVEKIPVINSLVPMRTIAAFPTEFEVNVDYPPGTNITKYEWAFGDSNKTAEITSTNKIAHTYASVGLYELKITITDSNSFSSSKIFNVQVGNPKEVVEVVLKDKIKYLERIKSQISKFPKFQQNSLNLILNVSDWEDILKTIERSYASAVSDDDYTKIMDKLINLNIPQSVKITKSADALSFYPKKNNIDLEVLKTVGGGDYDIGDTDKYIDAIYAWNKENLETKISYEEFSARYEHSSDVILTLFELNIKEKQGLVYDSYVIVEKLDGLKFLEDYSEREDESGNYFYMPLSVSEKTIVLLTSEEIDFIDLPLFISPELNRLTIARGFGGGDKKFPWFLLILIIFLLVLFAMAGYIGLQIWYRKKYEAHLFKNKNDLYNILTYMNNAKRQGLDNKNILIGLKKAGWKKEQIDYAMKKYGGKRTGMWEIPVNKILGKIKGVLPKGEKKIKELGGVGKEEFRERIGR